MVAQFCRFYPAYRAEDVLQMPAARFFAMWYEIPRVRAEEALDALIVQHGEPREVRRRLMRLAGHEEYITDERIVPGATVGTKAIDDERAQKIREELQRKREEWLRRRREQGSDASGTA